MLQRTKFLGPAYDLPPDQLGDNAFSMRNMQPQSAVSMRPRFGVSLIDQSFQTAFAQRTIYASAIVDDSNYSVLVTISNKNGASLHIEGEFVCHPGVNAYDYLSGLANPQIVKVIPTATLGSQLPSGVQFGNKFFIYFPDCRPLVIQPSVSGQMKAYWCGIQPPITGPDPAANSTPSSNLTYNSTTPSLNNLTFAYSYYSTARNVFSQPSPLGYYTIPALPDPPMQIELTGFVPPRTTTSQNDSGYAGDVDYLVVGVQSGVTGGLMALYPNTYIPVLFNTDGTFAATYTYTFDLSPAQLNRGFDLNALSGALYVPPASRFSERYGERIWTAGQQDRITFSGTSLYVEPSMLTGTVALANGSDELIGTGTNWDGADAEVAVGDSLGINQLPFIVASITDDTHLTLDRVSSFGRNIDNIKAYRFWRQQPVAKLVLSSVSAVWSCAHLYYSVYANGQYIGEIADVMDDTQIAYLDRDSVFISTPNFELVGHNDRIWPSGYDNHTPGNVPTPFPECAQVNNDFLLGQALDEGQRISGLIAAKEALVIAYENSFSRLILNNDGGGIPEPDIRMIGGLAGCIAPRTLCKTSTGDLAWVGNEGVFVGGDGGATNLLEQMQCLILFRGRNLIDPADLPRMVMRYSRTHQALIIGNFTVNDEANWWGLISPMALCLFNNQSITSNLLTYLDGNGIEVLIAGDNRGRIKKLLDDSVLTDLNLTDDNSAAYTCAWQGGWEGKKTGQLLEISRLRFPSVICPTAANLALTINLYRANGLQRELSRLPSDAITTVPITAKNILPGREITVQPNLARYSSVGFEHDSDAGQYTSTEARPLEITGIVALERTDA